MPLHGSGGWGPGLGVGFLEVVHRAEHQVFTRLPSMAVLDQTARNARACADRLDHQSLELVLQVWNVTEQVAHHRKERTLHRAPETEQAGVHSHASQTPSNPR